MEIVYHRQGCCRAMPPQPLTFIDRPCASPAPDTTRTEERRHTFEDREHRARGHGRLPQWLVHQATYQGGRSVAGDRAPPPRPPPSSESRLKAESPRLGLAAAAVPLSADSLSRARRATSDERAGAHGTEHWLGPLTNAHKLSNNLRASAP